MANIFFYVNGVKIHKFKANDSKIKLFPLCLGYISKGFPVGDIKKTGLKGSVYNFPVSYDTINASDIVDIHKYLMKKQYFINACIH